MPGEEPIPKPKKSMTYKEKVKAGLKRNWRQKPRSRLRSVSKKQQKRLKEYNEIQPTEDTHCEICGGKTRLSRHHKSGRGANLSNRDSIIWLCIMGSEDFLRRRFPDANHSHSGGCHGFVEANKRWARENGFLE